MSDVIFTIIEYFRSLANRHEHIECFRTGEFYELNESGLTYPLLYLITDFNFNYQPIRNTVELDWLYIRFKIAVITKSREGVSKKAINQIKAVNAYTVQDVDINFTNNIMQHIINKFTEDCEDAIFPALINDANGLTLKRIINDDCDGWESTINIKMENPYQCEYQLYFGDDIDDNSTPHKTNKTK